MSWIELDKFAPFNVGDTVLGCDWYCGDTERDYRVMVCEAGGVEQWWCGEKTGKLVLRVKNSICPDIGHGNSAHWMPLPPRDDIRWNKFDIEKTPKWEKYHEILIRLHNGNNYTGYIEFASWCPSYNMFKYGSLEDVEAWMELPNPPKYIPPPILSEEEMELRKEKSREWLSNFGLKKLEI